MTEISTELGEVSTFIRPATITDINGMVALSDLKRKEYEKAQPLFWRRAEEANEVQTTWFTELLSNANYILLVAVDEHHIQGFIIGELKQAPEVYDPGGLTLMIDDFCIEHGQWEQVGKPLLHALQQQAKQKGAVQTLVVCGHHDESKREFLQKEGLSVASEWYVKKTI
jgi:GNAT superfamily N-acetyltransferase